MFVRKVVLLLCLVPAGLLAQFHNALVYADDYFVPTPDSLAVIQALRYINDNLVPITWSLYYQDPSGFGRALSQGGWSIVIVDHANNPGIGSYWDSLAQWATGGPFGHRRLIVSSFDVDGSSTGSTSLWSLLGLQSLAGDMSSLTHLEVWDDQVFGPGAPQELPDTVDFVDLTYTDQGDSIEIRPGYTELAGWGDVYNGHNGASVLSPNCSWALNSFIVQQAQQDADSDGIEDGVELYIDLIWWVLYCPGLEVSEETGQDSGQELLLLNPVFKDNLVFKTQQPGLVAVWDVSGRQVARKHAEPGVNQINLSQLSPGVYMAVFEMAQGRALKRCIKVRP